jgi:hypothetical protein
MFAPILSYYGDVKKAAQQRAAKKARAKRSKSLTSSDHVIPDHSTRSLSLFASRSMRKLRVPEDLTSCELSSEARPIQAETIDKIDQELFKLKPALATTRETCVDVAEMAVIRMEAGNALGAQLSLSKLSPLAIELARLEMRARKLVSCRASIQESPESCAFLLKQAIQEIEGFGGSTQQDTKLASIPTTEADLSKHLGCGNLLRLFVDFDVNKIFQV